MKFCHSCGSQINDGAKFCHNCGAKSVEVQAAPQQPPVYQQQTQQPPVYQQQTQQPPVYQQQRRSVYDTMTSPNTSVYGQSYSVSAKPRVSIAPAIVSLSFGVLAIFLAIYGLLYSFIFVSVDPTLCLVMAITFAVFTTPASIVGMVLGMKYLNGSATRLLGMAKAGSGLGFASVGVTVISIIIGFLSLL